MTWYYVICSFHGPFLVGVTLTYSCSIFQLAIKMADLHFVLFSDFLFELDIRKLKNSTLLFDFTFTVISIKHFLKFSDIPLIITNGYKRKMIDKLIVT